MKILLDENLPQKLRLEISGHDIFTADYMGWSGIENGALLNLAADAGFDVLLTNDRGLEYEQDLKTLPIAVIVLLAKANTIEAIRPFYESLQRAIDEILSKTLVKLSK